MSAMPRRLVMRLLVVALPLALVATAAFKVGEYVQGQPHMEAAMTALVSAKAHLKEAADDKGGHRVAAMKAVDQAIEHVQAGIDYAKANH
ncbi:MAG TPA: hypothetical protein VNX15_06665 [Gemmatimonadales bacterium]|jgi:hypothetical protein|nr:hypothetical protein [Gemmatimonadales bacterium]